MAVRTRILATAAECELVITRVVDAPRSLVVFKAWTEQMLAPELRRIVVEHLEFVRLDQRRVVAVLVDRSGVVHNRILEDDEDDDAADQAELDRVGRWLTEQFAGRTLQQMREELVQRLLDPRGESPAAGTRRYRSQRQPRHRAGGRARRARGYAPRGSRRCRD